MTEVQLDDGSKVETNLPPEAVADLQQPADAPKEETPKAPEQPVKPAEDKAEDPQPQGVPEKTEDPQPRDPEGRYKPKPKPIANLLAQKHELETQLEAERKAKADLEAKLAELGKQAPSAQTTSDIKAVAEKYGLDEAVITDLASAIRAGFKPELPKEIQDLMAERAENARLAAEEEGFNNDLSSLQRTFKDEPLDKPEVREKLMELAYSEEKAPDGQPYFQKPLHELYFTFIKPEIEPGKPSLDASRGGSQAGTQVLDFQDIFDRDDPKDIEAMDDATFAKYSSWLKDKQGLPPIKRGHQS